MKRDMDLARKILLALEAQPIEALGDPIEIEGHDDDEVSYHIKLLDDARLLEGRDDCADETFSWCALSLTWEGHEFLDVARQDTRWERAKLSVGEKFGAVAFWVVSEVLRRLVLKELDP